MGCTTITQTLAVLVQSEFASNQTQTVLYTVSTAGITCGLKIRPIPLDILQKAGIVVTMKLQLRSHTQDGSSLAVTMIVCLVLGIMLAGYLNLTSTNHLLTSRSQKWNESIAVAEAGIEEALQEVNVLNTTFTQTTNWPGTTTHNGWSQPSADVYYSKKTFGDTYYESYVTNTFGGTNVVITSTGYVPWYYGANDASHPSYIRRTVVITAKLDPLFPAALTSLTTVDLKGNNIKVDSYDSSNPTYSNNGSYPSNNVSKTKANGDVTANGDVINSVNVGNANIKGVLHVGPNATVAIGPNGSVGDKQWVESGSVGIESGYYLNDVNMLFPDATLPSVGWLPAIKSSTKIGGVTYDYVINLAGDYTIDSFNNIYISSNVTARIRFDKSINNTSGQIYLASNANLQVYMNAPSFTVKSVINENGNPASFMYYGLPTNTSLSYSGNDTFVGCIYAPEADLSLGGGGNNTYDFIGSVVAHSITLNGHFNVHYDEYLKGYAWKGYTAINWREE
jgi:Tfp pilus assembly protein PilX